MPQVGILMGSDSDLHIMADAAKILDKLEISWEMRIISAHRTPEEAKEYAAGAKERGLSAIIAGAGGAAHLAGVLAAYTTLPVIGVPIKSQSLSGADSLYSIVQMPSGFPVSCVAINGAHNAGLLAAQIIGVKDEKVTKKLEENRKLIRETVASKDKKLSELGFEKYLTERIK